ncbi:Pickpocket protein 28-like 2 [Homarus americanus]|uniref:Pickpocket protein 28-like 2 n=1 Tax=Homarus americanus TaxID=6706 RepID=A0A8J5JJ24_HOMAM|nr:Pickpocket protein 28-like 2 [Homarus americanus]
MFPYEITLASSPEGWCLSSSSSRLFWLLCWLVSFIACCYYITTNISEFQSSPTLISIDSTTSPISKVDFPSITFCNFNHILKSRHPPTQEDVVGRMKYKADHWTTLTRGVYQNLFSSEPLRELVNSSVLSLDDQEVHCIIKESAQRCEDMILFCLWSDSEDCTKYVTQVPTTYGFCCIINLTQNMSKATNLDLCPGDVQRSGLKTTTTTKHTTDTTAEGGHSNVAVSAAGMDQGLTVLLDAQVEEYFYSTFHSVGFKIHLQEPNGPSGLGPYSVVVSTGKEAFIPIEAHTTFTTMAASQLRPDQRKCYQDGEHILKTSPKAYSHEACILNLETTHLVKACGCRKYHMPGRDAICFTQEQIGCMRNDSRVWHDKLHREDEGSESCYSRCNTTTYLATPSYASLPTPYMEKTTLALKFLLPTIKAMCQRGILKKIETTDLRNGSRVDPCNLKDEEDVEHLMQSNTHIQTAIKEYLNEIVPLFHTCLFVFCSVANIGGLLGLFLGFSLLSGAEIIFYLSKLLAGGVSPYMRTRKPSYVKPFA